MENAECSGMEWNAYAMYQFNQSFYDEPCASHRTHWSFGSEHHNHAIFIKQFFICLRHFNKIARVSAFQPGKMRTNNGICKSDSIGKRGRVEVLGIFDSIEIEQHILHITKYGISLQNSCLPFQK